MKKITDKMRLDWVFKNCVIKETITWCYLFTRKDIDAELKRKGTGHE